MPFSEENLLNQLLDHALSLPPGRRKAYLDQACPDPQMRAKLQRLISSCEIEVPDEFLEPPAESNQWIREVYYNLKREWKEKKRKDESE